MKTIIKYLSLIAIFLIPFSCTDNALEVASTQDMASEYYKTDDQTTNALMAAYDPMSWVWHTLVWGGSLKTWGNFASDDAYTAGGGPGDQPTYQAADTYTVSAADGGQNLTSFWSRYFMGNYRANLILDNTTPDSPFKKNAIAQAKFLKGFYYFYLSRMFGGLPIIEKVLAPTDITPRASIDETYTYIETLLEEAIASGDLYEKSSLNDKYGLATKASAQALLGKVYLYHKKYEKAIEVLTPIATNTNYSLEPGFWKIHKGTNRHGMESIFEINYSSLSTSEGNSDIYLFGPRAGVQFNDSITSGWGFNQPTNLLVDAFKSMKDNIRLNATVFYADTLQAYYNRAQGKVTPIVWTFPRDGFYDRKHYPDPTLTVANTHSRFSNPDIILRLADVYLMLAEAYVRTNNTGKALEFINKVRDRVRLPQLSSVTLADVKIERRLELALEGERYFDLVRWTGDADQIDADHVLAPLGYSTGTPGTTTKGLFPIPQAEINSTYGANKLNQNEGY
jgi:starch-binding outer membrane protein, SusD/RagB family